MPKAKTLSATAITAAAAAVNRGFADRVAPSFTALNKAGSTFESAATGIGARITQAFVACIAADHALTAKDVSKLVSERCAFTKEAGTPSTLRSYNRTFFSDVRNMNAVRRSIAKPEAMTPADFTAAVVAYAAKIDPRKAVTDAAAKAKAAAKKSGDNVNAERARQAARDTDAGSDLAPALTVVPSSVPALQGEASRIIGLLAGMDGGPAALATLQAQITAALTPAVVKAPRQRRAKAA